MAASEDSGRRWETQADVDACLLETGVRMDQVRRWRRKGLLPKDVEQLPEAYHGSEVRFPAGTRAQIRAAQALFREKDRVAYVGLQLWRRGFWVNEDHWRPRLRKIGRATDRILWFIARLAERFERDDEGETLQDKAARQLASVNNIIVSRIKRRFKLPEEGAILFRVLAEIGSGKFEGFDAPSGNEIRPRDESITIKAFDMDKAEAHEILGQNINFVNVLPSVLNDVAIAFSMGTLAQVAEAPAEEIAKARDDAMNALQIGLSLYDALEWVYGPGAFGLRLCAWLARKAGDDLIDGLTLGVLKLRAVPAAIHSSEKIAGMAKDALAARKVSKQLEWLWRHDPRYKQVLDPKRIRAAFADHVMLKLWQQEVRAAGMRSLPTPPGEQKP